MKIVKKISMLALTAFFSSTVFASGTSVIKLNGGVAKISGEPVVVSMDPIHVPGAPYVVECTLKSDQKSGQKESYVFVKVDRVDPYSENKTHSFILPYTTKRFSNSMVVLLKGDIRVTITNVIKGVDKSIEFSNLDDTDTVTVSECFAEPDAEKLGFKK